MPSDSDIVQDLAAVIQDTAEYLRFLKTLKVTHLGGAAESAVESRESAVRSPQSAVEEETNGPQTTDHGPGTADPGQVSETQNEQLKTNNSSPLLMPSKPPSKPAAGQNSFFDFMETPPPAVVQPAVEDQCLQDIRDDIGDCQRCKLSPTRQHIVFGDGNQNPDLVFVGEAPGADEDASGLPFVGRAGQLLNKIIEAIGMKRSDVYICNVIKCRPPDNRTPEKDEIAACSGFLHRQLALLKPKIIVSLGAPAAFTLLEDNKLGKITDIRGNFYTYRGTPLMVTFHPAYLLRWPAKKREVWEDMKKVRDFLRGELKL